jgi:hypothetical protein
MNDQEGRSAIAFTVFIALLLLAAMSSVVFAMTDGDPVAAYERMSAQMYWTARCKDEVPGACQMANIQW